MAFEKVRLGDCCIINPPKSEARKILTADDYVSFVPMNKLGINRKSLQLEKDKKLSDVSGSYTYFAENDVLLAKITPCFENGKLGIATGLTNNIGFGSSEFIVFRSKGALVPQYLYYYLNQPSFRESGQALMTGAVGHKRVTKDFIENTGIPLPPISEQKRIVALLDTVFADLEQTRAKTEQNLKNTRELFDSYLQQVFSPKGDGWVETTLGDLLHISSSKRVLKAQWQGSGVVVMTIKYSKLKDCCEIKPPKSEAKKSLKDTDLVSFVPMANLGINTQNLSLNGDKALSDVTGSYTYFAEDDVLLAKITPCFENGKLGIARGLTNSIGFGSSEFIVFRTSKEILPEYLYYFLLRPSFREHGQKVMTGAVGHKRVPKDYIENTEIPLPSIPEQKIIASKLSVLSENKAQLEQLYQSKLLALDELKKSILQKAFTGELTKETKYSNIIPFPASIPDISTTDLHAGIIAIAYQQHEDAGKEKQLGHVKAEKIAHMVESMLGINLDRNPIQDAAGPNDHPHFKKIESRAKKAGFFEFKGSKEKGYVLVKGGKFNNLVEKTRKVLSESGYFSDLEKLIQIMVKMNTEKAEIFTTVHAAWNNLLLDKVKITNETIVLAARENWHESKLKIPRKRFFDAIKWMQQQDLEPKGVGKYVT